MEKWRFNYDEDNDVLYISVNVARPSYCEEIRDGVLARYDMETDELSGYTILDFFKRLLEGTDEII